MMTKDEETTGPLRRSRMAPADRRALILRTAAAMFRDHGYAGASIDAIAAASGISGPGIYRYFGGKAELLLALLERAAAEAMAVVEGVSHDTCVKTHRLGDALADAALSEGSIIALLQGTMIDMDAAGRARLEQLRDEVVGRLSNALCSVRPELSAAEAEGRVVAALALVGHVQRFLATGADPQSFRKILHSLLRS
jgi:AcrR family transcriptional regulator